jgi:hypothetical protein
MGDSGHPDPLARLGGDEPGRAADPTLGYGPSKHYRGVQLVGVENYSVWKLMMESFMSRNELDTYVAEDSADEQQTTRPAKALYDELLCSIAQNLLSSFTVSKNARDLYRAVIRKFEDQSATHVNTLRTQLQRLRLMEGGDLYSFLEKFTTIAKELRQVDPHVSEVDLIQICITGIKTQRYEAELRIILRGIGDLTIDTFCDPTKAVRRAP